ncbi:tetratricopeptide repeat protein [Candidatus Brocadia sinica]|uniref:Protein contains FOG: TPR repeat n=1 Tax=Candidatus Brocadia sinica JPN1 TaxID=1197129 RepID=A0ABQ0JXS8_9BACT|nr:tetratricopeptide repeat protein [Candidatus Brocadia sinica]GAN33495.1 protein contains FOG: TPR repeat [Candidatus Brocadia sinica JPN1]
MNNKTRILLFTLITVLPPLAYLNSLENTFVYDDYVTITNNHFIREWRYLSAFFNQKYFVISGELTYRPIVTLSYFLEYALWQLKPWGYHLTNIIIHTLNVYLVYCMAYRLFYNRQSAFISSIIFSIHPLFTEAVNAVSYREDLLSATFLLTAFLFFLKSNRNAGRRDFIICYAFSLCAYLFALLSKEMAIVLPFLILAYDLILQKGISLNTHNTPGWHYLNQKTSLFASLARDRGSVIDYPSLIPPLARGTTRGGKKPFQEKRFLQGNAIMRLVTRYTGYLVVSVFYLYLRFSLFHNPGESSEFPGNSIFANGIMMTKALGYYFKLLFIPIPLNADYVVPLTYSPADASFIVSVIVVILVVVLSVKLCLLSRIWTFSILWFFITLLPVMNIIPIINIMAERYLYIPGIGFILLLGSIFTQKTFVNKCLLNVSGNILNRRVFCIASITIICLLLTWGTMSRNRIWFNEFTFSTETIRRSPGSFRMYNDLGYYYYHHNGFIDAAIQAFRDSIRVRYNQPKAHCNLGAAYSLKGLDNEAIEELKIATRLRNEYPEAHNNLGLLYKRNGMPDKAVNEYIEALKTSPYYADAHCNLGSALIDQGRLDEALSELEKAVKIRKNFVLAHYNIAVVYYKKGQMNEAYNKLLEACQLDPLSADVHISLGVLYLNHFHDNKKALEHIQKALRLNPKHRQAEEMKKVINKLTSAEGKP